MPFFFWKLCQTLHDLCPHNLPGLLSLPWLLLLLCPHYTELLEKCQVYSCLRAFAHTVAFVSEALLPEVHLAHFLTSFRYFLICYFLSKDFPDLHRWKSSHLFYSHKFSLSPFSSPFFFFIITCFSFSFCQVSVYLFYTVWFVVFPLHIVFLL